MTKNLESLIEALSVNPHPAARLIAKTYYRILDEGLERRLHPYSITDLAPDLFDAIMSDDFAAIWSIWSKMTDHMKRLSRVGPVSDLADELTVAMRVALEEEQIS